MGWRGAAARLPAPRLPALHQLHPAPGSGPARSLSRCAPASSRLAQRGGPTAFSAMVPARLVLAGEQGRLVLPCSWPPGSRPTPHGEGSSGLGREEVRGEESRMRPSAGLGGRCGREARTHHTHLSPDFKGRKETPGCVCRSHRERGQLRRRVCGLQGGSDGRSHPAGGPGPPVAPAPPQGRPRWPAGASRPPAVHPLPPHCHSSPELSFPKHVQKREPNVNLQQKSSLHGTAPSKPTPTAPGVWALPCPRRAPHQGRLHLSLHLASPLTVVRRVLRVLRGILVRCHRCVTARSICKSFLCLTVVDVLRSYLDHSSFNFILSLPNQCVLKGSFT